MYLAFNETFDLPVSKIFPHFETPSAWASLYGAMKPSRVSKDGWHSVPLKRFPFPLVARNVELEPDERVRWVFGGFWRGVGEVNFSSRDGRTVVEGFEYICPHGLWVLSSAFEERFMEKELQRIWSLGWKRLRKNEARQG